MDADQRAQLRRALELFEAAEYHAAHEHIDELWEATHGEDADFLKGLIQASIAMHHFQRGNLEGARKLYSGHRRYLGPYLPAYLGLDVADFLAQMQRALRPALRPAPPEPGAATEEPRFEFEARPRVRFLEES